MNNAVLSFEEYKNNNNNRNKNDSSSFSSSYSYYCKHGAGRALDERIAFHYSEQICPFMSMNAIMFIQDLIKHGADVDLIIDAIDATGDAPRPSFPYFRAVVQDWIRRGIITLDE